PRSTGLHDVRRPPRQRRRGADPGRPPQAAHRPARPRPAETRPSSRRTRPPRAETHARAAALRAPVALYGHLSMSDTIRETPAQRLQPGPDITRPGVRHEQVVTKL